MRVDYEGTYGEYKYIFWVWTVIVTKKSSSSDGYAASMLFRIALELTLASRQVYKHNGSEYAETMK
jgi:hypothetical protein